MLNVGDLILVRGHLYSPVDAFIKLGEYIEHRRPLSELYTHVAIFMGDDWVAEAQGNRKSGFARIETYEGDYDIGHTDLSEIQRKRLGEAVKREFNLPYDWRAILYIAWGLITGRWRKYVEHNTRYCCTFVNDALGDVGYPLTGKALPTVTDLADSPKVTIERLPR